MGDGDRASFMWGEDRLAEATDDELVEHIGELQEYISELESQIDENRDRLRFVFEVLVGDTVDHWHEGTDVDRRRYR